MKNKCEKCSHSLYLSDIETNQWHENHEEFVLKCQECGYLNIISVPLFDAEGHITGYNLEMMRKDFSYLPPQQLQAIKEHFEKCELCKNRFEERHIKEIEDKIDFARKSLEFFNKNNIEVMQPINGEVDEYLVVKKFHYNADKEKYKDRYLKDSYKISYEDEFFRDSNKVIYYLREDIVLIGIASFIKIDNQVFLEKIWFRAKQSYEKEKKFFNVLRGRNVELKLETLEAIFKRIKK